MVNKNGRPKRSNSNWNVQVEKLNVEIHFRDNIWFSAERSEALISDTLLNKIEQLIDSVNL